MSRFLVARFTLLCLAVCFGSACAVDRAGLREDDAGPLSERDLGNVDLGSVDLSRVDLGNVDLGSVDLGSVDLGNVDLGGDMFVPVDLGFDVGLPDLGCTAAETCAAGVHAFCRAGALTSEVCALGCSISTPTRCALFLPSNVDAALFDVATDITLPDAIDTSDCDVAGAIPAAQTGGAEVCVIRGRDITAPAGTTVSVTGTRALVLLAARNVFINGDLDVAAFGTDAGPGALTGGTGAGGIGTHVEVYGDGGGGGGGFSGAGGVGGRGTGDSGATPPAAPGGTAGAAVATTPLAPLVGGSPGGRGAYTAGEADPFAAGGGGGGALQISARGTITLRGSIDVGGGGGQRGHADGRTNYSAGGGGGSGGGVLIEAPSVVYEASARVQAIGGGGGAAGGADNSRGNPGDGVGGSDGQDGIDATDRAAAGTTTAPFFAANGGRSGGGSAAAGENGVANTNRYSNGGGAGGGVGCVVVRTASGALPANAALSAPSALPALRPLRVRSD